MFEQLPSVWRSVQSAGMRGWATERRARQGQGHYAGDEGGDEGGVPALPLTGHVTRLNEPLICTSVPPSEKWISGRFPQPGGGSRA